MSADHEAIELPDEHMLWSLLDEYMNANGVTPQLAGVDNEGTPFFVWLDEVGGDEVELRVARLIELDGGTQSVIEGVETPKQGETSTLVYPVKVLSR